MGPWGARAALFALALLVAACDDPPNDDELIAHFNRHRNQIKELASFIRENGHLGYIREDSLQAGHALRHDPDTLKKVRGIMDDLGIEELTLSVGATCLYLKVDGRVRGGIFNSRFRGGYNHIKGFQQCDYFAPYVRVVEDTDKYIQSVEVKDVAIGMRHLENDWYLYHMVLD